MKPVIVTESSSLRELSIDDKINEAELIVIGKVNTTLPSKWKKHNKKDTKEATPQEIFEGGGLFTDSIFSVDDILKGVYEEPTMRVRSFIGESEQIQWKNPSEPSFKKGQTYILFLEKDTGPTADVDPGDYISVNSNTATYEIIDGTAVSSDDEWVLDDLITYIKNAVSQTP